MYRTQITVEQIEQTAREIAAAIDDERMSVAPNGTGWRIECTICHASKVNGEPTWAREHAATHN